MRNKLNKINNKGNFNNNDIENLQNNGIKKVELLNTKKKILKLTNLNNNVLFYSKDGYTNEGNEGSYLQEFKNNGDIFCSIFNRDKIKGLIKGEFYYNMKKIDNGSLITYGEKGNKNYMIIGHNNFHNFEYFGFYNEEGNFESTMDYANISYDEKGMKIISYDENSYTKLIELIFTISKKDGIDISREDIKSRLDDNFEIDENGNRFLISEDKIFIDGKEINKGFKIRGLGQNLKVYGNNDNIIYNQIINGKDNIFINDKKIISNQLINHKIFDELNYNNKINIIIPLIDNNSNEFKYKVLNLENGKIIDFSLENKAKSFIEDSNGNFVISDSRWNTYINGINNKVGNFEYIDKGSIGSIGGTFSLPNNKHLDATNDSLLFCSNSYYFQNNSKNILQIFKDGKLYIDIDVEFGKDDNLHKLEFRDESGYYIAGKDEFGELYLWKDYKKLKKIENINSLEELLKIEKNKKGEVIIIKNKNHNNDLDIEL